jgi:tRNA threonylcarbamoyl adenosine modification protein YjeE
VNGTELMFEVESRSVDETQRIGSEIAATLEPGDVVLLVGELGAGKTSLVKAIVESLGGSHVTSPTFTLCHRYATSPPLAHVDCYRIDEGDDLADLALDEVIDEGSVALVEWGDRFTGRLGDDVLWCTLSQGSTDPADTRRITFEARGASWSRRLPALHARVAQQLADVPTEQR